MNIKSTILCFSFFEIIILSLKTVRGNKSKNSAFILVILTLTRRNVDKIIYFIYLPTKNKPADTKGPIPSTNTIVPIPTTPPKYHPPITALISIIVRIKAIGKIVIFCNTVINPSIGQGPRLAIKKSKDMMYGNKFKLFLLSITWILMALPIFYFHHNL